jgi:predicted PurR-regulated permease PerM
MVENKSSASFSLKVVGFIGVIIILYVLKPLIMPLLLAAIFAVMIFPVQKFLERRIRCNRLFATIFSIASMFSLSLLLLFFISNQLETFLGNGEAYISRITDMFTKIVGNAEDALGIRTRDYSVINNAKLGEILEGNFDKVSTFVFESGAVFSDLLLIPIYLFFFLYYRRFLRNFTYKLFINKPKNLINKIINEIYHIQQSYLAGLLKVMVIVGVLNTIGLLLLGIENAVFFGFFAALLLVVPYVGVIIGALLPALVALVTKDSYWYAFGVVALFACIQFIEGNFITPKITGGNVSINSFVAIFSLIAFAMLWGVMGMIVALPITASIKILCDHSQKYQAYGFIIGQPENKFLKSSARHRLKKWKAIRKNKK